MKISRNSEIREGLNNSRLVLFSGFNNNFSLLLLLLLLQNSCHLSECLLYAQALRH